MLKNLLRQTATILEEVVVDEDGYSDEVFAFATVGDFLARLESVVGAEVEVDRDTITTRFKLFLEEKADGEINARSRVVVNGIEYQVVGSPNTFWRRMSVNHVEAMLRRIEA